MSILTSKQESALATDRNIAVTAGAGTGKTRILVERYLHILLTEDVEITDILAITFTDKAAAEMKQRVAERIDEMLVDEDTDSKKIKLIHLKNRLSAAYISTIHSFCMRMLRENPVEAGLEPDFKVMSDLQNQLLLQETIADEMRIINQEEDAWIDLFRLFGVKSIYSMVELALANRYEMEKILGANHKQSVEEQYNELVKYYISNMENVFDEAKFDTIDNLVNSITVSDLNSARNTEKAIPVITALENYRANQKNKKSTDFWHSFFELANRFTSGKGNPYNNLAYLGTQKAWNKECGNRLVELSEILNPVYQWESNNPALPPADIDKHVLSQLQIFYELYSRILQRSGAKKREISLVDFEDLQLFALKLFRENDEVRNKISRQFKYVLVDEFQDTNKLQWDIISNLGDLASNKFFIVGDPKQSIYGFRNADVRVFNSVKKQFTDENPIDKYDGDIILDQSFRFKQKLNSFINIAFAKILTESDQNPWEVEYNTLSTQRADKSGGKVEFALLDKTDDTDNQSQFITNRIIQLVDKDSLKYGDLAILLRSRNHLLEIEERLRISDIPFKTIGGIGFYQRQEIYDVYHLIQFLIDPNNDPALIGVMRSPFANISDEGLFFLAEDRCGLSYWERLQKTDEIENIPKDDQDKINLFLNRAHRWLNRRDRIDFSELLSEIIEDSFYQVSMVADFNGDQLYANLEKILRIAEEYEKSGFTSLMDFAESLKQLINAPTKEGEAQTDLEDETTVKLMTIHQAKGLEFPVVFLPYLEQQAKSPSGRMSFLDEDWGMAAVVRSSFTRPQESYYLLDLLRYKQKQKELAELKRLFYVGCSRAKDQLILTSGIKEDKIPTETPLDWLLNSLDISIENLVDGNMKISSDEEIDMWRHLPEVKIAVKKTYDSVFSSIKKLESQLLKTDNKLSIPDYLRIVEDQPKREIFSATQLMTFLQDKKAYYHRYHLGFFEEDYDRLIGSGIDQDLALVKGKIIHRYFEKYPDVDIDSLLFEFEVLNPDFATEITEDLRILEERMNNSLFLKKMLSATDHKNEISITMKLSSDYLTGTIDRLNKNENGMWEVIDYKTNKIEKEQVDQTADNYSTQIEVYALLLSAIFPGQKEFAITLYFIQPDAIYQKIFGSEELEKIEQRFITIINALKNYYPYSNNSIIENK